MSEISNPALDAAARLAVVDNARVMVCPGEDSISRQQPIIVLGMHRSGTSLLAELIHKWGAFGNERFLAADYRNSQGYWEYQPLVYFNRRLLLSVQSQSFVPPSDEAQTTLAARALEPAWRDEALQLVSAMEAGKRIWYWKDPRLTVMLAFWQHFWTNPIYVIAVREPVDTALSLKKIYGWPVSAGYVMWQRYMTSALESTPEASRRIFVQYERLLSGPLEQCTRLSRFLAQRCRIDDGLSQNQRLQAMLGVINPGLRTAANSNSFLSVSEASAAQKSLYCYLQSMTVDETPTLDPLVFEIFPGWRDYLQALATSDQLRDEIIKQDRALGLRLHRKLGKIRGKIVRRKPQVEELPW